MNEEIINMLRNLQKLLEENNLEINENGDLADKNTKRLVMEKNYE